jgi:hypothetical protein
LSKPCYIEMASEESDVENRYRCDESELNDTLPSPIDAEIRAQGQNVTVTFFTAINLTEAGIQMIGGDLPVTRFFYGLGDIVNDIDKIDGEHSAEYQDAIRKSYVQITEGGTWFFDYSAHAMSSRASGPLTFAPITCRRKTTMSRLGPGSLIVGTKPDSPLTHPMSRA